MSENERCESTYPIGMHGMLYTTCCMRGEHEWHQGHTLPAEYTAKGKTMARIFWKDEK